jgi:MFS family permease
MCPQLGEEIAVAIISRTQTNSRADRPEIQTARAGSSTESGPAGRWRALALLCSAQFIVILDGAIVNVALPSIQRDLHFSASSIQWVLSAYLVAYGGLLLLGGRTADLLGRRRMFMVGAGLLGGASLFAGLSGSQGQLIGARAAMGVGAAVITPAALSIILGLFSDGGERNRALGIWGAIVGLGAWRRGAAGWRDHPGGGLAVGVLSQCADRGRGRGAESSDAF